MRYHVVEAVCEADIVLGACITVLAPPPGHMQGDIEHISARVTVRQSHWSWITDVVRQITAIGQLLGCIILLSLLNDRLDIELSGRRTVCRAIKFALGGIGSCCGLRVGRETTWVEDRSWRRPLLKLGICAAIVTLAH